jgi:positive regulator of sigma E activity
MGMDGMFQDLLATVVALGAAAYLGRRVLALVRPDRPETGCSSCAASAACGQAPVTQTSEARPAVLVRRTRAGAVEKATPPGA